MQTKSPFGLAFVLFPFEALDYAPVAARPGVMMSTVESRLFRGHQRRRRKRRS